MDKKIRTKITLICHHFYNKQKNSVPIETVEDDDEKWEKHHSKTRVDDNIIMIIKQKTRTQ